MIQRLSQLVVVPLVVAGALAVVGPASATDYCVAPNDTCAVGNNLQDFQDALNHAAALSDADRIFLGAGTYAAKSSTGFAYNQKSAVEIIGAGRDPVTGTTVTGPSGADFALTVFGGANTSVHDLRVVLPPHAANGAVALWIGGAARRVTVTEDSAVQTNPRYGIQLSTGGAVEDHSVVALDKNSATTGVILEGGPIRDSTIDAGVGIEAEWPTVERTRVTAGTCGIRLDAGQATITSSEIHTTNPDSAGIVAAVAGPTSVDVDGVTIVGPGTAPASGSAIEAYNVDNPSVSVDLNLRNSVLRGYHTSLYAGGLSPGHAHVSASYSDYDPSGNFTTGTTATISQANVSNIGNVGFAPGGYVPTAGSPLIDAGDPATVQGLDVDGNALVSDGNGDGVARRDIGAYELQPAPAAGDSPPPVGGDITTGGGGTQPARPDITAPVISGLRVNHRTFAVGRARTALVARTARGTRFDYSLSETAKVVLTIQRAGAKRPAGRLIRAARNGRNTLRFSGRIASKALKPGRYHALVTATDKAGNRSVSKRVAFRVLNG